MLRNAQHTPAERSERTVTRRIMALTPVVRATVDLDGEAHLGASKVDDVIADDELAAKGETGLGAEETTPEPLFARVGEKRMKRARSSST